MCLLWCRFSNTETAEALSCKPSVLVAKHSNSQKCSHSNSITVVAVCSAIWELEEQAVMARFQKRSSKLHHLLSTSTVAGIYRSPYQALTNTVPVLDKSPLEDQIRASRKKLVCLLSQVLQFLTWLRSFVDRMPPAIHNIELCESCGQILQEFDKRLCSHHQHIAHFVVLTDMVLA